MKGINIPDATFIVNHFLVEPCMLNYIPSK